MLTSGVVRAVAGMRGILLPGYLVRSINPSALLSSAPTPALPRCGKGGLGWGPMTAERREFSHFLSSATRTSPDFVIQDIILSILCILSKKFNGIGDCPPVYNRYLIQYLI